jgi:hypothetical protein
MVETEIKGIRESVIRRVNEFPVATLLALRSIWLRRSGT